MPSARGGEVGLWMDDLRVAPFTSPGDLSRLEMTNGGGGGGGEDGGASSWEIAKDGNVVVASTSDIQGSMSGSADIRFALYSEKGALLTYRVRTSTTGPHEDFAILLNKNGGEDSAASSVVANVFGDMLGYERRSLAIPKGKVLVTLSHRKNPGRLSRDLLLSLGEVVGTEGRTWLEDLSLDLN
jgi:hypothetical protein